jgi:hypothetical protein
MTGGQCVTWHGLMLAASTWRAWNNRGQRKENMQRRGEPGTTEASERRICSE